MKKKAKKKAAARRGRPLAQQKLEKLVAYLPREAIEATRKAARLAGSRSLSAWASGVLEREAHRILRDGKIPLGVLELPSALDRSGSVRRAVQEEREAGW